MIYLAYYMLFAWILFGVFLAIEPRGETAYFKRILVSSVLWPVYVCFLVALYYRGKQLDKILKDRDNDDTSI